MVLTCSQAEEVIKGNVPAECSQTVTLGLRGPEAFCSLRLQDLDNPRCFLASFLAPSLDLPEPKAVFLFYDGENRPGEVGSFLRMFGHTWTGNQSRALSGDLMNNLMTSLLPSWLKRF